jgi:hypothetical protein
MIRLVQLIMPFFFVSSSGTGCRSTLKPASSRSLAAFSACARQSPGGLSEGVFTSSARKRVCASRLAARNAWILSRAVMVSGRDRSFR